MSPSALISGPTHDNVSRRSVYPAYARLTRPQRGARALSPLYPHVRGADMPLESVLAQGMPRPPHARG